MSPPYGVVLGSSRPERFIIDLETIAQAASRFLSGICQYLFSETAEHENTPAARRRALAIAREFYQHILETGIDLVDTWMELPA